MFLVVLCVGNFNLQSTHPTVEPNRVTESASCCQNSTMRPFRRRTIRPVGRTNHFMTAIEQLLTPHTIYVSSWTKRPARPGPSMDLEDMLRRRIMVTKTIRLIEYQFGSTPDTTTVDSMPQHVQIQRGCAPSVLRRRGTGSRIPTGIQTHEHRGIRRNDRPRGLD